MSDWEPKPGIEEEQFQQRLLLSGDKVSAAKGTLVDVNATDLQAQRAADKALLDPTVQMQILDLMEEAGIGPIDIIKTYARNLHARKLGIVQKTGEVKDVGEDNMAQIQAANSLAKLVGWHAGGVKAAEVEKAPPKYELHFHNHEAPIDDEGDIDDGDVIEVEYTALPD